MKPTSDTIRKAAVLVSSLDTDTADKLLDQMPAEMADRVRRAMASLDDIDQAEQDAVLGEFVYGNSPAAIQSQAEDAEGVELSAKLARDFGLTDTLPSPATGRPQVELNEEEPPFRLFSQTPAARIGPLLTAETPQTIALVATHLPPAQAAQVLASLPFDIQPEVMRRMANLDETHPDILREVERGLTSRLTRQDRVDERRVTRVAALAEMLRHAAPSARRSILENLGRCEPELAEELVADDLHNQALDHQPIAEPTKAATQVPVAEPPPIHASLDDVDEATLTAALAAVDAELATLALAGSSAALLTRVARRLPAREAKRFRRALDQLGPTRLSDIEEARQQLLAAANRWAAGQALQPARELVQAA